VRCFESPLLSDDGLKETGKGVSCELNTSTCIYPVLPDLVPFHARILKSSTTQHTWFSGLLQLYVSVPTEVSVAHRLFLLVERASAAD
jgi:hypothetical protein